MFSGMQSPLDMSGHPASPGRPDEQAAEIGSAGRLTYAEILRELAGLLGEQLAREELAKDRAANPDDCSRG